MSVHRLTTVLALVAGLLLTPAAVAQAAPADPAVACKDGGWRTLVDREGRAFENQGRCVAAAVQGDLGQPLDTQVTGPFTGTTEFTIPTPRCSFVFQEFDLTTSAAAGAGSVSIEGCVDFGDFTADLDYTGSFTLTSPSGGTLTGPVVGTINGVSGVFDFTLTAETSTGSLSGATGTLQVTGVWETAGSAVSGTVTGQLSRS